jgi:hypothetical protein
LKTGRADAGLSERGGDATSMPLAAGELRQPYRNGISRKAGAVIERI